MSEVQTLIALILTFGACTLISFAMKDAVLTTRDCIFGVRRVALGPYSSQALGIRAAQWFVRRVAGHRLCGLRRHIAVAFFALRLVVWNGQLIVGFTLAYAAARQMQTVNEPLAESVMAAAWLSLAVSFRIGVHAIDLAEPTTFLLANIQFYSSLIFFALVCAYAVMLRRQVRELRPRLYRIADELECEYSPFRFAETLRSYGTNNMLLILRDWEEWADGVEQSLVAQPQLVYSGFGSGTWNSWLGGLMVILDTSTALVTTSAGAIREQASLTLTAASRAVCSVAANLGLADEIDVLTSSLSFGEYASTGDDDDILSADILSYETGSNDPDSGNLIFEVHRLAYLEAVGRLSKHLGADVPNVTGAR